MIQARAGKQELKVPFLAPDLTLKKKRFFSQIFIPEKDLNFKKLNNSLLCLYSGALK